MTDCGDGIVVEISGNPLRTEYVVPLVEDPACGAIATFTGITRNTFQGKQVLKLEYEAYTPMALKKLKVRTCGRKSEYDASRSVRDFQLSSQVGLLC